VLRLHVRHKSLTSSAKQPTPIQLCRTLRTRWDNRKVTIGQLFISSDVFLAVVKRDIFSSFTVYIKLMMMMMIANMDTQLNFVPSHCPKILPVPFVFIYCITNFFVYTCLEKKWRGAYEPFKTLTHD